MDRGCHAISPTQKGRTVGSAGGKEYYSRPPARVGGGFYSLGWSFFRFSEEKLRGSNTLSIRTPVGERCLGVLGVDTSAGGGGGGACGGNTKDAKPVE
jgi:hypothetical protein